MVDGCTNFNAYVMRFFPATVRYSTCLPLSLLCPFHLLYRGGDTQTNHQATSNRDRARTKRMHARCAYTVSARRILISGESCPHPPACSDPGGQFLVTGDGQLRLHGGHLKLNDFNSAYFMSTSTGPDGTPCEFSTQPWQRVVPWRPPEFALGQV